MIESDQLTDPNWIKPLRLLQETIQFVHLINRRFRPSLSFGYFFYFFSQGFQIFRICNQIEQGVRYYLQYNWVHILCEDFEKPP